MYIGCSKKRQCAEPLKKNSQNVLKACCIRVCILWHTGIKQKSIQNIWQKEQKQKIILLNLPLPSRCKCINILMNNFLCFKFLFKIYSESFQRILYPCLSDKKKSNSLWGICYCFFKTLLTLTCKWDTCKQCKINCQMCK